MNPYNLIAPCTRRPSPSDDDGRARRSDLPKLNTRRFSALYPLMQPGGLYPNGLGKLEDMAYFGLESSSRANVTFLPPWKTDSGWVFGSTLGHHQADPSPDPRPVLEVYESLGHGAMLIDCHGKPTMDLYILTPGDKVGTANDCIMTIFNLGTEPAILLDIANPVRHQASKTIQQQSGPALAICYRFGCVRVRLNGNYVNRSDGYGVVDPRTLDEIALPVSSADPEAIAKALLSPRGRRKLRLLGIKVHRPSRAKLAERMGLKEEDLEGCLADLDKRDWTHPAVRYLFGRSASPNGTCGAVSRNGAHRVVVIGGGGDLGVAGGGSGGDVEEGFFGEDLGEAVRLGCCFGRGQLGPGGAAGGGEGVEGRGVGLGFQGEVVAAERGEG